VQNGFVRADSALDHRDRCPIARPVAPPSGFVLRISSVYSRHLAANLAGMASFARFSASGIRWFGFVRAISAPATPGDLASFAPFPGLRVEHACIRVT
jgi:hypothetical protein